MADPQPEMPNFNDLFKNFDKFFGGSPDLDPMAEEPKPEKAPVWAAKTIDGKRYVSLEQVAELLAMNDVLPAVRRGIERRL